MTIEKKVVCVKPFHEDFNLQVTLCGQYWHESQNKMEEGLIADALSYMTIENM